MRKTDLAMACMACGGLEIQVAASPIQSQRRQDFQTTNSSQAQEALHTLNALAALFASFAPASSAFLPSNRRVCPPSNINCARSPAATVVMGPRQRRSNGKKRSKNTASPSPGASVKSKYAPARVTTESSMSVKRQIHLIRAFERSRQKQEAASRQRARFRVRKESTITEGRSSEKEGSIFQEDVDIAEIAAEIDLDSWNERTILLVDGYNVIGANPDIRPYLLGGDPTTAANILIEQLSDYAANTFNLTIVFDASGSPANDFVAKDREDTSPDGSCRIVWAHDSADLFLVRETARLRQAGTRTPVMVVTDDNSLAQTCFDNGARPAAASMLLLEMEYSLRVQTQKIEKFNTEQQQQYRVSNVASEGSFADLLPSDMDAWHQHESGPPPQEQALLELPPNVQHLVKKLPPNVQALVKKPGLGSPMPAGITDEERRHIKDAKKKKKSDMPATSLFHSLASSWQDLIVSNDANAGNVSAQDEEIGVDAEEAARIKAAKASRLQAEKARVDAEDEASIKAAAEALELQVTASNVVDEPEVSRHFQDIWDLDVQEDLQPVPNPTQDTPDGQDMLDLQEREALQPVKRHVLYKELPRMRDSLSDVSPYVSEPMPDVAEPMPGVSEGTPPTDYTSTLAAVSRQSSADKAQRSALAAVQAAIKAQKAVLGMQQAASSTQDTAVGLELSALDARRAALEAQRASVNAERALRKKRSDSGESRQQFRGGKGPKNRWQRFTPAGHEAPANKEKSSLPDLGVIN